VNAKIKIRIKSSFFMVKNKSDRAVSKMNRDFSAIFSVYRKLNDNKKLKSNLVPASEWLLDNFYIIQEHTKQIKWDFTFKMYRGLPVVESGYTRTFIIARKLVAENPSFYEHLSYRLRTYT